MEQLLPKSNKIKLVLNVPANSCDLRKENVSCYYRGIILDRKDDKLLIEFKYKNEVVISVYNLTKDRFEDIEYFDIKIKR